MKFRDNEHRKMYGRRHPGDDAYYNRVRICADIRTIFSHDDYLKIWIEIFNSTNTTQSAAVIERLRLKGDE
mgnify:CR=1 FL=1